jgi:hypothetical protein
VTQVDGGIGDGGILEIVLATFNEQNLEVGIGLGKTAGGDTSSGATSGKDDVHIAQLGVVGGHDEEIDEG